VEATIGSRLKAWRHALGLTQAQFAERIGVHIGVLKKYEQGLNIPGGDALAAIAKTGVNMNWLLTGEGEMLPRQAPESALKGVQREHLRRWEAIVALVQGIEDQAAREAALDELYARAQTAAELAELRRAVAALQKKAG
jgi:transcriptional regulator with XRE-family HTH domain